MIKEISLAETPFYKSLILKLKLTILAFRNNPQMKLNEQEIYQEQIFEKCTRIDSILHTLRLSRFFIAERLDIPFDNNFQIKNGEFIRYHIECFFIRITTYKDLILKLINKVYKLSILENNGLESNLLKEAKHLGLSDIINLIEQLNILMKHIKPIRNKIAHENSHRDIDLTLVEADELIKDSSVFDDEQYRETLKELLRKNIFQMHNIEKEMVTFTILVFDKLYPVREQKEKEFA